MNYLCSYVCIAHADYRKLTLVSLSADGLITAVTPFLPTMTEPPSTAYHAGILSGDLLANAPGRLDGPLFIPSPDFFEDKKSVLDLIAEHTMPIQIGAPARLWLWTGADLTTLRPTPTLQARRLFTAG